MNTMCYGSCWSSQENVEDIKKQVVIKMLEWISLWKLVNQICEALNAKYHSIF